MEKTHPTYTIVKEAKDADACGWGTYENDIKTFQKIYFKFPEIKPEELRIKIHYAGLCYSEVHTLKGDWGPMVNAPVIPGHEIVGEVTHLGSKVSDFKVGDIVGFGTNRDFCGECKYCKIGETHLCKGKIDQVYTYGHLYWGGYATALQQPAKLFFKIPSNLPLERVAPLFCAGITTYKPVAKYVKKDDEVAVLGIGGLGHMAVFYAKAVGAKVTCFTGSKNKIELCKSLGADHVVVVENDTIPSEELDKFDCVINTITEVTQKFFDAYTALLSKNATWVQLAAPMDTVNWRISSLVFKEVKFVGSLVGSKTDVQKMLDFSSQHNIVPICEQFEFEDFPKAWEKLAFGRPHFRCVVNCKDGK